MTNEKGNDQAETLVSRSQNRRNKPRFTKRIALSDKKSFGCDEGRSKINVLALGKIDDIDR